MVANRLIQRFIHHFESSGLNNAGRRGKVMFGFVSVHSHVERHPRKLYSTLVNHDVGLIRLTMSGRWMHLLKAQAKHFTEHGYAPNILLVQQRTLEGLELHVGGTFCF